jgi:formate dehydrogenase major subunit
MLLRALPSADAGSLLCEKGRFGFGDINKTGRVTTPLIRTKTGLVAVGFEGAITFTNDSLKRLQKKYGNECVAFAISDRYTNEEAALIIKYAAQVFHTNMVYSLGLTDSYISGAPAAAPDDLETADLIVLIAPKPEFNRSVMAMKVRRAERNGAKRLVVNDYNDINSALAEITMDIKNAVFIYDTSIIPVAAARRIVDIAIDWTRPGERKCGVIQLLPGANSRGLYNLGVRAGSELRAKLDSGEIRGLFAFGEGIVGLDFRSIEFLAVQKLHLTEAARQADVVLPASYFAEADGSFTAYDNVTRALNKAVDSPVTLSSMEQIQALINQG